MGGRWRRSRPRSRGPTGDPSADRTVDACVHGPDHPHRGRIEQMATGLRREEPFPIRVRWWSRAAAETASRSRGGPSPRRNRSSLGVGRTSPPTPPASAVKSQRGAAARGSGPSSRTRSSPVLAKASEEGAPPDAIQLLDVTDRGGRPELEQASLLDIVIRAAARSSCWGGRALAGAVLSTKGLVPSSSDADADLDMATAIVVNARRSAPPVQRARETRLVEPRRWGSDFCRSCLRG